MHFKNTFASPESNFALLNEEHHINLDDNNHNNIHSDSSFTIRIENSNNSSSSNMDLINKASHQSSDDHNNDITIEPIIDRKFHHQSQHESIKDGIKTNFSAELAAALKTHKRAD